MAHGGYDKRKVSVNRKSKGLAAEKRPKSLSVKIKNHKKPKAVSLKNQIRSTERMLLRKGLPFEVKEAQEKKLEGLKKQLELQTRLAVERKIFLRDRKIKFFERRKIERRIRRLEKLQRTPNHTQDEDVSDQLSKLKEDLEYVRFFPKTEKYVSLFIGGDDAETVDTRNRLREKIKTNITAAIASGKDLEETGSEDDGLLDMSDDDFFLAGSSSDEADADDEWTDKSAREQASSASGKATSGMSSDEKNQRQVSARALMPPPRPSKKSVRDTSRNQTGSECSSRKGPSIERVQLSTFGNKPHGRGGSFQNQGFSNSTTGPSSNRSSNSDGGSCFRNQGFSNLTTGPSSNRISNSNAHKPHGRGGSCFRNQASSNSTTGLSSNLSSNSDAHKPRRKRRPKKKKQQDTS